MSYKKLQFFMIWNKNDMTCDGILTFWIYFFLILSVLLNEFRLIKAGRPNELHIGGIFPIAGKGGWQGGQACMPAARLALDDVNKETNLLPGFRLILHSNDSEIKLKSTSYLQIVSHYLLRSGVVVGSIKSSLYVNDWLHLRQ
ncbi:hypothetical protein GQX74_005623 [Glossina fuscipes]|nr:hypothetical protein GQX74_005623 [Glossina fuscipes]